MNGAWQLGYRDAKNLKDPDPKFPRGPVAIVGKTAYDYHQGYRAANSDRIWANNNRPPITEVHP